MAQGKRSVAPARPGAASAGWRPGSLDRPRCSDPGPFV